MAAVKFDPIVLEELNDVLKIKCSHLTFFYREKDGWRDIGINYHGVEASKIELREPENGKLRIETSLTSYYVGDKIMVRRHFNKCLRYLAAMIAAKEGYLLESLANSPISLYSMTKMFNCKIRLFGTDDFKVVTKGSLTMDVCKEMIEDDEISYEIIADLESYETYKRLLIETFSKIDCSTLGGKRKRTKRFKNRRRTLRLLL